MIKDKEKNVVVCSFVNEKLDSGDKIIQKIFFIGEKDNELSLKEKTQKEEHRAYPEAIIKIFRNC